MAGLARVAEHGGADGTGGGGLTGAFDLERGFGRALSGGGEAYTAPVFPGEEEEEEVVLAPLVTVVSASGGTGRSTLALLAAHLAAASGIKTTLVEADLQFGDLGFWLGLDDELPTLGEPESCAPIGLGPNLELYKAPLFPEVAEEVADAVAQRVPQMREGRGLVVADTGGFWSGMTASLLLQSDLFLLVVDSRPCSVSGAVKVCELCDRMGVPRARMVVVYNRWSSRDPLTAGEVRRALHASEVLCIPHGKGLVGELLSRGEVEELVGSGNAMVRGVHELLAVILPRLGYLYAGADVRAQGRGLLK